MLSAVLDSCVLFPMYLRDTLLCASEASFYLPFWSQAILDGTTRNLVSTGRMSLESSKRLEARMKAAFPDAMVVVPDELTQVMTNHPGDRHVLATAVLARADIIVTSNLKHFQQQNLAPWNIEAQSPDEFLTNLYNIDPEKMVKVLQRQSQSLRKPPMSFTELLDLLGREVPDFVRNVLSDKSETL
ncbi:PIN domain-containing protein [Nostoc parmelioides]|uniref:PIN domain-containing protein n=1 Tax=Nostoc parmelioides FACHB-3921 TaxID=2692909 RepID=A0ABR8B6M2_9NOSO|nr:PIN domain-containing protein [Nostoc parmelioides]MBD2249793.1 PIN domain-containing protein [Nostoc parmelioides FACHB-3921]